MIRITEAMNNYKRYRPLDFLIGLCFFVSAFSEYLAYGFAILFILLFVLMRNRVCLLKAFALYVLRVSVMNSYIFQTSSNGAVRNALLILFSVSCLFIGRTSNKNVRKYKYMVRPLYVFVVYVAISSFICSSYPLVSLMKLLLFSTAFLGVLRVISSEYEYPWIRYFTHWFTIIMLLSLLVIPFVQFRTRNGRSFQGIFAHPNVFAIFASAFVCLVLVSEFSVLRKTILILPVLYMQYLSASRTGLFSAVLIITIYLLVKYRRRIGVLFYIMMGTIILGSIIILLFPDLNDYIIKFIWKGAEGDILYSRSVQVDYFLERFESRPIVGTGFMTPYKPDERNYSILFDLYVEDGNLFLGIIGQTGILGLLLFLWAYIRILKQGNLKNIILCIAPLIISSGEMVFFSTNSLGFFFYIFYGVYAFSNCYSSIEEIGNEGTI